MSEKTFTKAEVYHILDDYRSHAESLNYEEMNKWFSDNTNNVITLKDRYTELRERLGTRLFLYSKMFNITGLKISIGTTNEDILITSISTDFDNVLKINVQFSDYQTSTYLCKDFTVDDLMKIIDIIEKKYF